MIPYFQLRKMTLKLNSDSQPYVKINAPKYEMAYSYERDFVRLMYADSDDIYPEER